MTDSAGPKGRSVKTEAERAERLEDRARKIAAEAKAEQDALDAAVRRSIKLHGA